MGERAISGCVAELLDAVNCEGGRPYARGERACRDRFAFDVDGCACRAEPHARGDVLVTAAPRAFLRPADDERRDPQPTAHQECAPARGTAELVRGDRAEVDIEL